MLWVDGLLSTLERLSILSFLKNGHAVHLYTYGDVPNLPTGALLMDGDKVLPDPSVRRKLQRGHGAGSWAFFSNLFRYRLLYERGGIWCDTDMVCLRPLEFAVARPRFFATERVQQGSQETLSLKVNDCAMQAPAGDEVMLECFERASKIDGDSAPWGAAGPDMVSALVNERQLVNELLPPDVFCPVDWWKFSALMQGPQWVGGESYTIHFWNEMWRRNFFDKNAQYDPLSIYERLKSHYLGKEG